MDIRFGIARPDIDREGTILVETSTIIFCPYCGAENYIGPYTSGDTTGIKYCIKCGRLI